MRCVKSVEVFVENWWKTPCDVSKVFRIDENKSAMCQKCPSICPIDGKTRKTRAMCQKCTELMKKPCDVAKVSKYFSELMENPENSCDVSKVCKISKLMIVKKSTQTFQKSMIVPKSCKISEIDDRHKIEQNRWQNHAMCRNGRCICSLILKCTSMLWRLAVTYRYKPWTML